MKKKRRKKGCFIPSICLLGKPRCDRKIEILKNYDRRRVFLDIPYARYKRFEHAICSTLIAHNLTPVLGREKITSKERICKLCVSILSCKYGIADVSYPTLNVPFELGLLLAYNKPTALLCQKRHWIPKHFSDMQWSDSIVSYSMDKEKLMWGLSKWISGGDIKERIGQPKNILYLKFVNSLFIDLLKKEFKNNFLGASEALRIYLIEKKIEASFKKAIERKTQEILKKRLSKVSRIPKVR